MKKNQEVLLAFLKGGITPATGCTEPIAVAYAVAKAKEEASGNLESIHIQVDSNIYKNGLMVTIPGTTEKGLLAAAAFGFLIGKTTKRFRVIEGIKEKDTEEAQLLIKQKRIILTINENYKKLYVEVNLITDQVKVQVITLDHHLNIVSVRKVDKEQHFTPFAKNLEDHSSNKLIQKYALNDFFQFITKIPRRELAFLEDGVIMNLEIAQEGFKIKSGVAVALTDLVHKGLMDDNMITRAQILCAAASEARMSGSRLPVMSTAGSGNHGITVFLTNYAVAEKRQISSEKLYRSLALSHLITFFIKSYTGTLSAMCGCGIAAGIGASAGVVYLLGGNQDQIMGALRNMVGSISGIICDGAKDGCAYKLALTSGWAIQSALLSLKGTIIHKNDGIVDDNFKKLFENLGYICDPGMISTDKAILKVMERRERII